MAVDDNDNNNKYQQLEKNIQQYDVRDKKNYRKMATGKY